MAKNVGGRPSNYTDELAAEICAQLADGYSLRSVCRADDMPDKATVFRWLGATHEDGTYKYPSFRDQYARAKQEAADAMAEEILDIADDGVNDWMEKEYGNRREWVVNGEALQRSRLRVDTRKWLMAKMKPKKYGDKIDMTTNGKDLPTPILGGVSAIDTTKDIKHDD
jgi:hypothetical protein